MEAGRADSGASRQRSAGPSRWTRLVDVFGRVVLLCAVALGVLTGPLSCTTRVTPPVRVAEPVTVFLLDHGRTPSLVLPDGRGGMIRYAYGDWNYYALRNTGFLDSLGALLWPTQGALGRKAIPGPMSESHVRVYVAVGIEALYPLAVEEANVASLRDELEALYHANVTQEVVTPSVDLSFVPHPIAYTYFHNSNHRTAAWLETLGCDVHGPAFYSRWRVERKRPATD